MKICIVGNGVMGSGIAQGFAQANKQVILKGTNMESLNKSKQNIEKSLDRLVLKNKIDTKRKEEILEKITLSINYDDLKDVDIVVEAVSENIKVKKEIFKQLDNICKKSAILASNTSSLSITEIASSTNRPENIIGMHFFNPVPVMKLVEVINGQLTSNKVSDTIYNLAIEIGKVPVNVNEAPGFVVNRILQPMINEAIGILADGVASKEEIDEAMKLGANHPIGPLALADLCGLDVVLAIMDVLYEEYKDSKYRAHPLLRKMVRANQLGRKTSKGFYDYK